MFSKQNADRWLMELARVFLKLAQWDFNNFIPLSTCVYEAYGMGKPHGRAGRMT